MERAPEMYYVFCSAQRTLSRWGLTEDVYKQYSSLSEEIMDTIARSRKYIEIIRNNLRYLVARCNEELLVALKEAKL